ncbi:MAG: 2-oxo acid dehydrogenase subunit E2 [Betaproteobacteria bacterium]|jgi:pyruvate dehydrogenase E2 component (dihydrolipoamide acetyltransferase)|nr:2-oxo acid dehydrogenase subunit E2 [Betaproteobacteria bacterium]MDH5343655.1 2-oxo acid dehydrogenase subunit E2 [Betaproteobacteria bacterium]
MDIIMPQLGETVTEGVVTKWYKKVGDTVKADETLFDVETDKVSTEIPSPVAGVVAEIVVAEGVTAKVGVRLAVIRESGVAKTAAPAATPVKQAVAASPAASTATTPSRTNTGSQRVNAADRLSPVVRRLVAEHSLNPADIAGTGRDGRITREDVTGFIAQRSTAIPAATAPRPVPAPAVPGQTVAFTAVRKRVAENMAKSWSVSPHVLQVVEADFSRVDLARKAHGAEWKRREGFALTYLPFIVRAVSIALGKFPKLNASLQGEGLALHRRINIGIAVDLNFDGLLVPVVKDVPAKSLPQIAKEINDLAQRARAGKLRPDEMTEGTYTITNNGAFGTVITAPIINQPQVAILSADGIRKKAVVIEGEDGDSIAIRPVGVLAQSFDHRALDGSYSAAFLAEVKNVIETRDWAQALSA